MRRGKRSRWRWGVSPSDGSVTPVLQEVAPQAGALVNAVQPALDAAGEGPDRPDRVGQAYYSALVNPIKSELTDAFFTVATRVWRATRSARRAVVGWPCGWPRWWVVPWRRSRPTRRVGIRRLCVRQRDASGVRRAGGTTCVITSAQ